MSRPKMSDKEWVEQHCRALMDLGKECAKIRPEVSNRFGYLTILKLCALKNYVDIYTKILHDKRLERLKLDGRAYLDVFAGSGLNLIGEGERTSPFPGSTPIATRFHHPDNRFHKYYAIELNEFYVNALTERLSRFVNPEDVNIVQGDADENLPKVVEDIEERNLHYLAFVDYEGAKGLSWESLKYLLEHKGDLWITFIPSIARTLGRATWSDADRETLVRMLGEDVVDSSQNLKELYNNFLEKIRTYRERVVDIRVTSGGSYHYQLIFATRRTSGESSYVSAVNNLKRRIEGISGRFIEIVLKIMKGEMKSLEDY